MRNHLDIGNKPACNAWSTTMYGGRTVKVTKDITQVDCMACKRTIIYRRKIKQRWLK